MFWHFDGAPLLAKAVSSLSLLAKACTEDRAATEHDVYPREPPSFAVVAGSSDCAPNRA